MNVKLELAGVPLAIGAPEFSATTAEIQAQPPLPADQLKENSLLEVAPVIGILVTGVILLTWCNERDRQN